MVTIFTSPYKCIYINNVFTNLSCVYYSTSIGSLDNLKEYETERQRHNLAIQGGVDFLHRLYNYEFAPVVALRTIGLSVFNSSETLKVSHFPLESWNPNIIRSNILNHIFHSFQRAIMSQASA